MVFRKTKKFDNTITMNIQKLILLILFGWLGLIFNSVAQPGEPIADLYQYSYIMPHIFSNFRHGKESTI